MTSFIYLPTSNKHDKTRRAWHTFRGEGEVSRNSRREGELIQNNYLITIGPIQTGNHGKLNPLAKLLHGKFAPREKFAH